jgi:MFS superfamily sulfate permease-like transporter
LTELLSKPLRYGYMNEIALTVLISQLPKLLGFSIESEGQPVGDHPGNFRAKGKLGRIRHWARHARHYRAAPEQQAFARILIAVVAATVVVDIFDLGARYGVKVLGPLPQDLSAFAIPWIGYNDLFPFLIDRCAIALVSFADTSVLSRTYAARLGDHVDPNQEMVGSAPPIWRPDSFKVFRSAAAPRARN